MRLMLSMGAELEIQMAYELEMFYGSLYFRIYTARCVLFKARSYPAFKGAVVLPSVRPLTLGPHTFACGHSGFYMEFRPFSCVYAKLFSEPKF